MEDFEENIRKILEGLSPEQIIQLRTNLTRLNLESKPYIKKYTKYRKLHSDIVNHMIESIETGKIDISELLNNSLNVITEEKPGLTLHLDTTNEDDANIFYEMLIYNNYEDEYSITDLYLNNHKFRNKDKVDMLDAMKNSYVGLFKVLVCDSETGYVTLLDVFTRKVFKIVDIALSTHHIDRKRDVYYYNRIITIDGISFGTGIHITMTSNNKELMKFIKTHKYKKFSNITRCTMLYNISMKEQDFVSTFNKLY